MTNDQQYDDGGSLDALTDALASQGTDSLRVTEASTLGVLLAEIGGEPQSAVDVAARIDALADALASNATDELRVQEASPLDVSGAVVSVQEDAPLDVSATTVETDVVDRSARTLGKARLMDSGGTLVDPATDSTLSSTLSREIAQWSAGTLPVEQQTPIEVGTYSGSTLPVEQQTPMGVEDTSGTQVDPAANVNGSSTSASTTATGSGSAAAVSVPNGRTAVTAAWDVSGSATVTVEVSPDGGATWYEEHTASPSSAETATYNFSTGFDDVRVFVDSNLNSASIGAKGS